MNNKGAQKGNNKGADQIADWPRGYKTFLCSTQLSMKFQLLVKIKMLKNTDFFFQPDKCCIYGKCSKISNTLKLRTPKIIAENNF